MTESMDDYPSSGGVLQKEIQDQSEREAAAILEQVEKEAQQTLNGAQKQANTIRKELIKKAEAQAEKIRRKILSSVHLEVKKQTLKTRESLLAHVFQEVENKLDGFRRTPDYPAHLIKLIIEGILALGVDEIRILPGEIEKKQLSRDVLYKIADRIKKQTGREVVLTLADQVLPDAGVVLVSADERMLFDNRFKTRMQRMKNEMRLTAVKRILE